MRRSRLGVTAAIVGGLLAAAAGCSLINTDGLTGGLALTDGKDSSPGPTPGSDGSSALKDAGANKGDAGPPPVSCVDGGSGSGFLNDSNNCGACGHDCLAGLACDNPSASASSCAPASQCVEGVCQPVVVAPGGTGRAITQFSGFGLVWSSVTVSGAAAGSTTCALVVPTVYGVASSSMSAASTFTVAVSTGNAFYASGLASDVHGITSQDTNPMAGTNYREVGFGTMKAAGAVGSKIYGLVEPPQETVLYFFSENPVSRGPHEWTSTGANFDSTGSIPLDTTAPEQTISAYDTVAMAADATWLYYGTAEGVFRIRGGQACVGVPNDAGDGGADKSACEGLFIPLAASDGGAAITVTALAVDNQYLYVATSDGMLVRYQTVDGSNPMTLSTAGPFYGITQQVSLEASSVEFGTNIFASSAAGSILQIDSNSGTTTLLATSTLTPMGITVDSPTVAQPAVYWVEDGTRNASQNNCPVGDGRVMKIALPPQPTP